VRTKANIPPPLPLRGGSGVLLGGIGVTVVVAGDIVVGWIVLVEDGVAVAGSGVFVDVVVKVPVAVDVVAWGSWICNVSVGAELQAAKHNSTAMAIVNG
jgi:hypothetical protein